MLQFPLLLVFLTLLQVCQGRVVYLFSSESSTFVKLINKVNSLLCISHFICLCAAECVEADTDSARVRGLIILSTVLKIHALYRQQHLLEDIKLNFLGGDDWMAPTTLQPPSPSLYIGLFGMPVGGIMSSHMTRHLMSEAGSSLACRQKFLNPCFKLPSVLKFLTWNVIPPQSLWIFFVYSDGITLGKVQVEAFILLQILSNLESLL